MGSGCGKATSQPSTGAEATTSVKQTHSKSNPLDTNDTVDRGGTDARHEPWPDTSRRWPNTLVTFDRVSSDGVVSATSIAVVTVAKASVPEDFRGFSVTSVPTPLAAQPTVFHVDRLI